MVEPQIIVLDWKQISDIAISELKKALAKFGLYLGDADLEINHEATGDTYYLYISEKKLPKEELSDLIFPS